MIQKFVEDALQCVTLIEQALDAKNIYQLQEAAHGLKGIARNMGANSLAQLAGKIEADCKAGNTRQLVRMEPPNSRYVSANPTGTRGCLKKRVRPEVS